MVVISENPEIQTLQLAEMVERSKRMLAFLTSPVNVSPGYESLTAGWRFDRGPGYGQAATLGKSSGCRRYGGIRKGN